MKIAVITVACLLQILGSGVVHGANPNYSYHVKIDDPSHINFQEKAETRKGEDAQGFYSVLEPNGALRTVSYTADERGFNPIVSYSYGHPQSSVAVHSATGPAAIVKQPGVYAPAYVSDQRVQIVDKSNIYAAPPPALNLQAFALPGPSAPVVVPQPLRVAAPVVKASAAIATNYAPAYVPPPTAYLPPPPAQVVVQQPQVVVQQPQVLAVPQPQVLVKQQQVLAVPAPQPVVFQQPALQVAKVVQPAKFLTAPALKVVKTSPAVAVVKDSYSEPPRNTFRDPNAPSYPDSVKVSQPVAEYGPPAYVPPPPVAVAEAPVKVVQQVAVQKVVAAPPPAIAVQKFVAAPPPAVTVQKVVAAAPQPIGLYAGAIGFHNVQANADSYVHAYGTQGFQVTSSRKFNHGVIHVPKYAVAQKVVQPAPVVYGPPPVAIAQKVVQPAPVYGPPARVVQPAPVYGPPEYAYAQKVVQPAPFVQQVALPAPPPPVIQQVALPAPPPPVVQNFVSAPLPQPAPVALAAPVAQVAAAPVAAPISLTGKKQNPLTFAYSYDQGGAKVTHSYSGSGW